jgi:acetylglutamate kinase
LLWHKKQDKIQPNLKLCTKLGQKKTKKNALKKHLTYFKYEEKTNTVKQTLVVLKIGGNVIDNPAVLTQVLNDFAQIKEKKILVHGGGKIADTLLKQLDILPKKIEGRRITDAETLDVVVMVYAGLLNKKIVAQLQANACNALGLCGADLNLLQAHKRVNSTLDYGFAGNIDAVNSAGIEALLQAAQTLVVAPISHDKKGQLLNTNADTVASNLATALADRFEVTLKFCFEKQGVLADSENDNSVISTLKFTDFEKGKANGSISEGMIPKLKNAFDALEKGVHSVQICGIEGVLGDKTGTTLFL